MLNQLHAAEGRRRGDSSRARIDEGAVHPWPAIAAAKLAVNSDDLPGTGPEVREVCPRQLELGGVAPRGLLASYFCSLQLEVLERWEITHTQPGFNFRVREG